MPVLREQDFDKMAGEVVDQFLGGHAKLAQAAAKIAIDHGLNPDQSERLVQSANTMTFLRMMDQRKQAGVGDLMHEFDPIDSRQIIRIVIDNAGIHISPHGGESAMAHQDQEELPDEMSPHHAGGIPEGMPGHEENETPEEEAAEQAAARPKNNEDKEPPEKKPSKEAAIMRARKLAGILEDQRKQAEWAFEDRFNDLVGRFRQVTNGPSFYEFEKDAMAEFNE